MSAANGTMTVDDELATVGRTLLADGHFDNEPDAVLAAIWVLACAHALERLDDPVREFTPSDASQP